MTTEPATLAAAEFTEDRIAGTLMQAARLLVDVQGHVQPEALAAIPPASSAPPASTSPCACPASSRACGSC